MWFFILILYFLLIELLYIHLYHQNLMNLHSFFISFLFIFILFFIILLLNFHVTFLIVFIFHLLFRYIYDFFVSIMLIKISFFHIFYNESRSNCVHCKHIPWYGIVNPTNFFWGLFIILRIISSFEVIFWGKIVDRGRTVLQRAKDIVNKRFCVTKW